MLRNEIFCVKIMNYELQIMNYELCIMNCRSLPLQFKHEPRTVFIRCIKVYFSTHFIGYQAANGESQSRSLSEDIYLSETFKYIVCFILWDATACIGAHISEDAFLLILLYRQYHAALLRKLACVTQHTFKHYQHS